MKSKSKQLSEKFGGEWKYDGSCCWWCNDGVRHVARVHTGGFDVNGEAMPGYGYYLYGNGIPRPVYFISHIFRLE